MAVISNSSNPGNFIVALAALWLLFTGDHAAADDICTFSNTANVPPKIVILLDNGAAMANPAYHPGYNPDTDYTTTLGTASVFNAHDSNRAACLADFKDCRGYSFAKSGDNWYLSAIKKNLQNSGHHISALKFDGSTSNTSGRNSELYWTINGRTILLPAEISTSEVDGITDANSHGNLFRYSTNYLNWLFYGGYTGNGTDLPALSQLYYGKKAVRDVIRETANKARFSLFRFTNDQGASSAQLSIAARVNTPLAVNPADNLIEQNFMNAINNVDQVLYSPLAEGLASIGDFLASPSSHAVEDGEYCQKLFAILITAGLSSKDQAQTNASAFQPDTISHLDDLAGSSGEVDCARIDSDNDGDDLECTESGGGRGNTGSDDDCVGGTGGTICVPKFTVDGTTYDLPLNYEGSSYLDDVAYFLATNDAYPHERPGAMQPLHTYTVSLMASKATQIFLRNVSNNGNGFDNLTDSRHENYGKYHFDASDHHELKTALLDAINNILSRTSTFTAPVVPVTRTTSGNRIYMAFFKPASKPFWEGTVAKFAINSSGQILGADGNTATHANGALKADAVPYWQTRDWAGKIPNAARKIYTFLGPTNPDYSLNPIITAANEFKSTNTGLTAEHLGQPATYTAAQVIDYVRGADILDEDNDGNTLENRTVITGDVLHSEPVIVTYNPNAVSPTTYVFYGANDGMLHAVNDSDGSEAWSFILPEHLPRLKSLMEGTTHPLFIDGSPQILMIRDWDGDGVFDSAADNGNVDGDRGIGNDDADQILTPGLDDLDPAKGDRVILLCGTRGGGASYFALDITVPTAPKLMWRIGRAAAAGYLTLNTAETFQDDEIIYDGSAAQADLRISTPRTILNYDHKSPTSQAFAVGDRLHGGSSGASATIDAVSAATDTTGSLSLSDRSGWFSNNEMIYSGGFAKVNDVDNNIELAYDNLKSPFTIGRAVKGGSSGKIKTIRAVFAGPDTTYAQMGETWSEPKFGLIRAPSAIVPYATIKGTIFDNGNTRDNLRYLHYDNLNGSLASGVTIVGQTSGATASLSSGASFNDGTLALNSSTITGIFYNNEFISPQPFLAAQGNHLKPVFFVGGGFDKAYQYGKAIYAIHALTGQPVKSWSSATEPAMNYSIASNLKVIDSNDNGITDLLYVGDLGGQLWRLGKFSAYPHVYEDISTWTAHRVLATATLDLSSAGFTDGEALEIKPAGAGSNIAFAKADGNTVTVTNRATDFIQNLKAITNLIAAAGDHIEGESSKASATVSEVFPPPAFYYAPSYVQEKNYDLIYLGSGDREDACNPTEKNRIFVIKDTHSTSETLHPHNLVDLTWPTATVPNLDNNRGDVDANNHVDKGWFITLKPGEKVLAEGTVFFRVLYMTTFTPVTGVSCVPGGSGKLYALNYKTGAAVDELLGEEAPRSMVIGGGIPSKPVLMITDEEIKLLISVGTSMPDDEGFTEAGVKVIDPESPTKNFYYNWWRDQD